jgi:hypothetical protein
MGTEPGVRARGMAITAAIFGFFASSWFGWAQAAPPAWLEPYLVTGSVLSVLVLVAGVVLVVRYRRASSAPGSPAVGRRYGIIVGIEFGTAGLGAAVLGALGQAEYIPVWICAVVGVHFVPLAPVLRDPTLRPLAAVLVAVAAAGLVTGLATDADASATTGAGAGLALLAWGAANVVRALRLT